MDSGYKTIAVHANESPHCIHRLRLAARLAVKFEAHLVGVAATGLPVSYYLPVMAGNGAVVVPEYLDALKERADASLALFESVADKANVAGSETRSFPEEPELALTLQARYSDLLVIGQDDPEDDAAMQPSLIADYVFLHAICPVLIVPHTQAFPDAGSRVLLAWNGSAEAARAVRGAIPFLQKAEFVEVLTVDAKPASNVNSEFSQSEIAAFLDRHGVKVEMRQETRGRHDDTASLILTRLAEIEADLLVMGGYGHSRFREVILGGTTRKMLKAVKTPVLISH